MTAVNAADVEHAKKGSGNYPPVKLFRLRILAMALIVSLGGLIFGYDTGESQTMPIMEKFSKSVDDQVKYLVSYRCQTFCKSLQMCGRQTHHPFQTSERALLLPFFQSELSLVL